MTITIKTYAAQNNEHDYLDYGMQLLTDLCVFIELHHSDTDESTVCWGVAVPIDRPILPRYVFVRITCPIYIHFEAEVLPSHLDIPPWTFLSSERRSVQVWNVLPPPPSCLPTSRSDDREIANVTAKNINIPSRCRMLKLWLRLLNCGLSPSSSPVFTHVLFRLVSRYINVNLNTQMFA